MGKCVEFKINNKQCAVDFVFFCVCERVRERCMSHTHSYMFSIFNMWFYHIFDLEVMSPTLMASVKQSYL